MDIQGINQVLSELRAVSQLAAGSTPAGTAAGGAADFGQILKGALEQVNASQTQAQQLAREFSLGAPGVNLQDAMINLQKASLSFQQLVQVRNKVVSAYHEIMNMQI